MEFSTTAFLVLFAVFLPVAYCIRYAAAAWCYEMAMKPSKHPFAITRNTQRLSLSSMAERRRSMRRCCRVFVRVAC